MADTRASTLRKTPLFDLHERLGGRMVEFGGWAMPVHYRGIVEEHHAVRRRAGVFDVSHMGRLFVARADAASLLRRALTYDADRLAEGRGHYTLLCNDDGGIIDDPYLYRLDHERFLLVGNAANAARDTDVVRALVTPNMDVELLDRQESTVMLAVQGPQAVAHVARIVGQEPDGPSWLASVAKRGCTELPFLGYKLFASRTGYTGEDGFELATSIEAGRALWSGLIDAGVEPCGLGARDTLRLEAALPLWGHDIDESTNPYEAGLGWVVSLAGDADFIGRDALSRIRSAGVTRKLAHLRALDRGVIRDGCAVLRGDERVGTVTSGGFSPTLGVSIAMAYLPVELAAPGTEVEVDVRGRVLRAAVVRRPFVDGGAQASAAQPRSSEW